MKQIFLILMLLGHVAGAATADPPSSIYHLQATLTDQSGASHGLDIHRGRPVLVTMFYGNCPMACPMLIDTLRAVERAAGREQTSRLRVLMISIDPDHDTVANLQTLARNRKIDTSRWTLARTDDASVRKIAALLNVQYRQLPDGGFNHSSVISVLTPQGEIAAQSALLGKADEKLLSALQAGVTKGE